MASWTGFHLRVEGWLWTVDLPAQRIVEPVPFCSKGVQVEAPGNRSSKPCSNSSRVLCSTACRYSTRGIRVKSVEAFAGLLSPEWLEHQHFASCKVAV